MTTASMATRLAVLGDAVAGSLAATSLILFKNNPGVIDVYGDMTQFDECDFSGYTAVAGLVWGTPFVDVDGNPKVTAPSHNFILNADTTLNDVWGYALTDVAKAEFRGAFIFPGGPIVLSRVGQGFEVQPEYPG